MLLVIILLGLGVGILLNWLADILPRFSPNAPAVSPAHKAKPAGRSFPRALMLHAGDSSLPLVSVAFTASGFGLLGAKFGMTWEFAFFAVSFTLLTLIALIDLKYRLVLNVVIYPLAILVVLGQAYSSSHDLMRVLLGGGMGFGVFFLTAYIRPGQLGGGDVKLATLIGLAFGFPDMLWALLVGGGAGAVMAVLLLVRGKGKAFGIPYAPFLCFGAMIALLVNPFAGL